MIADGGSGETEWGGAGSDPRPHLEPRRRAGAGRRERRWRAEGLRRRRWSLGGGTARGGCGARRRGWGLFIAAGRRWGGRARWWRVGVASGRPASGVGRSYGAPAACWRRDAAARPARWHSGDLTARAGGEWGQRRCAAQGSGSNGGGAVHVARRSSRRCGSARSVATRGGSGGVRARGVRGSGANREAATSWRARERGASRASSCVRGARVWTRPGRGVAQLGVVSSCARRGVRARAGTGACAREQSGVTEQRLEGGAGLEPRPGGVVEQRSGRKGRRAHGRPGAGGGSGQARRGRKGGKREGREEKKEKRKKEKG